MNGPGGRGRRWRGGRAEDEAHDQVPQPPIREAGTGALATTGIGELKRSLIETALLIALIDESGHGYTLIDRVQQILGNQVFADAGSVYRILRLLEEAGMITSSWETGAAGPQRRRYTVEPAGRVLLDSWATSLAERGKTLGDLSRLAHEHLAQTD